MLGVWLYFITFCTCVRFEEAFGKGKPNLLNVIHKYNGVPPYLSGTIQSLYKQKKIIFTRLVIRKLTIRVKDRVAHMPFNLRTDEINEKYLYKYRKLNLKHYLLLKTR
jgi:hypothetical protein